MKVGVLQLDTVWENPQANIDRIGQELNKLKESIDVLLLPEMYDQGYIMTPQNTPNLDSSWTVNAVQELAREFNILIGGSLPNQREDKYYNTFAFIEQDGPIASYDKIHLFTPAGEANAYEAGSELVEVSYKNLIFRPLVCYDLRFPYCSWNDTDYDVLIYAANWPMARIHQWNALLQARAIENQAYVIGVNRLGKDKNDLAYNGQSKVYDFSGNLVLDCKEETKILTFTIDKPALDNYRIKLPFLNDQK